MQLALPDKMRFGGHRVLYLFVGDEGSREEPWDPECGDNAVILQGGEHFAPVTKCVALREGPSLHQGRWMSGCSVFLEDFKSSLVQGEIGVHSAHQSDIFPDYPIMGDNVPLWLQNDDTPLLTAAGHWRLLLQMTDEHWPCWVPFRAWGYIFVAESGQAARFLFQET